jgi:hypothetical protein
MANVKSLNFLLTANTKGLQTGLRKASVSVGRFTKSVSKVAGPLGLALGGAALISGISNAVKGIAEFEKELSKVQAISGATAEQMNNLIDSALELGGATKFTAKEVASLQFELSKLGFSAEEITAASKGILDLASATGTELPRAAEVAGATIRQFGLLASDSERVVNVMAAAFSSSALDLESFAESMKFVGPIANSAGLSIEKTTAILGLLAEQGIKGSQAATGLRRVLLEAATSAKPFEEALQDILEVSTDLARAEGEVGKLAVTVANVLAKSRGDIDGYTEALTNTTAASDQARIMLDNLSGDVTKLGSAWDGLVLSMGQGKTGFLRVSTQVITDLINEAKKGNLMEFLANPMGTYARNAVDAVEAAADLKEENEKIAKAVEGAFASPNIEKYIEGLEFIGGQEKAIAIIRGKLKRDQEEQNAKDAEALRLKQEEQKLIDDKNKKLAEEARLQKELDNKRRLAEELELRQSLIDSQFEMNEELKNSQLAFEESSFAKLIESGGVIKDNLHDIREELIAINLASEEIDEPPMSEEELSRIRDNIDGISGSVFTAADGFEALANVVTNSIGDSTTALQSLGNTVFEVAKQIIKAKLAEAMASMAAGESSKGLIGIGTALVGISALQAMFNSKIPKLAQGGLAFAPQLAVVGDNPNAGSDPEVIAPLSKLTGMMGGAGGGVTVILQNPIVGNELEVGEKLISIIKEAERN